MMVGKKILAGVLASFMIFSSAYAKEFSREEEKTIIKGVTYKHIEKLTESGWQDIYVVRADLTEPHLAFSVLDDVRGESYLLNTLDMAKNNNAVAAINADFFAAKKGQSGRGSAVGLEIIDGKVNTTPSVAENMNVLYQLKEDLKLYLNSFVFDMSVTAPNGETAKIRHINKYDDLTEICMYTSDWGELSPGSGEGIFELVVEDGKVKEKLWAHEPAKIPESGYVLSSHLSYSDFLDKNFEFGDEVKIEVKSTPDYNRIKNAVGGGGLLVIDGKAQTKFSHTISGINPRSAVGIDETGTIITLVAVDGRRQDAKGMTQTELAKFMESLGCYNALNLDGGGSTLLALCDETGYVVANKPSDNYRRPVANSIGITTNAGDTPLYYAVLETENKVVFKNASVVCNMWGYDEYSRKKENITASSEFSALNGGVMEKNIFRAEESGISSISATDGVFKSSAEIVVLDRPYKIEFSLEDIRLKKGESYTLELVGYDKDGTPAPIRISDAKITLSNDAVHIKDGKVVADKSGSCVVSASFGEVVANAVVTVDGAAKEELPENIEIKDSQERKEEIKNDGFRFTVLGNMTKPKTLFELFALNRTVFQMNDLSFRQAFLGDVNEEISGQIEKTRITAKGYGLFTHKNSTFLTVKNTSGEIYSADKTQWNAICDEIEKLNTKNLFVFMDDMNISQIDVEKGMFKEILSDAQKKGTNVMVFGAGDKSDVKKENGVYYITASQMPTELSSKNGIEDLKNISYFVVTVNDDEVTFYEKNILE